MPPPPPRLRDRVRQVARQRFGPGGPGERYAPWARRLVLFHAKRHPRDRAPGDTLRFREHVAQTERGARRCLAEAPAALPFLDHEVLGRAVGDLPCPEPPRLPVRRRAGRVRQFAPRTETGSARWAGRFLRSHGLRHPGTMGAPEIDHFLTDLAANGHVAAGTPNRAFHALLFLDQQVRGIDLPRRDARRARRPQRRPSVPSPEEVRRFLDAVEGGDGRYRLMARWLSGTGLRRPEGCAMRVHDLDWVRHPRTVRHGKGGQERVVRVPRSPEPDLRRQLAQRRPWHERDRADGRASAPLPSALAKKFPRAAQGFGWQYLFAARHRSRDPKTGNVGREHVPAGGAPPGGPRGGAPGRVDGPRRLPHPAVPLGRAPRGARRRSAPGATRAGA